MKKNIQIAFSLLCFALVGTSCEKRDPEFFDEGGNGAYFDYETAAEYDKTLNFSDHIVGYPDTVSLMLKVKWLMLFITQQVVMVDQVDQDIMHIQIMLLITQLTQHSIS